MKQLVRLFTVFVFLALAIPGTARAYPEFIGYGYSSCLTCHFNSQGNGPLNDYGRALFAAEIASRSLFPKSVSDDTLGENSGFLGAKVEMPWWLRPGIKYRGLWYQNSPGAAGSELRHAPMQKEINAAVFFTESQNYAFVGTLGSQLGQNGFQGNEIWVAREYYFRAQPVQNWWLYLGVLDKVFGIRHVDHTLYSRAGAGLDPHSYYKGRLTHGVMVHYTHSDFDVATHLFFGNIQESEDDQPKGASITGEYSIAENSRFGLSYLNQSNSKTEVKESKYAVHHRLGLGHGSAILGEIGYLDSLQGSTSNKATYAFVESQALVTRGYNIVSMIEYLKRQGLDETSLRWGVGLLAFPLPRVEYRVMAVDQRTLVPTEARSDRWQLQLQLHLSL